MSKPVNCQKLKQELPGLEKPPFPGPLGEKIHNTISAKAWGMWVEQQKMIINENRISLSDPAARKKLQETMKKFLFEDSDVSPSSYTPESDS